MNKQALATTGGSLGDNFDKANDNFDEIYQELTETISASTFNTVGVYLNGSFNTSTSWRSAIIYCYQGTIINYTLHSVATAHLVTFFDIYGVIISSVMSNNAGVSLAQTGSVEAPENTVKVAIGTHNTYIASSSYSYDETLTGKVGLLRADVDAISGDTKLVYKVSKTLTPSVSGHIYSTIAAGLAAASANPGSTLYIYDGIYLESNLTVPDKINIIGIGVVEIRGIGLASASSATIDGLSTLNASENFNAENITVTGKNMRYPIHADFSSGNTVKNLTNCKLIHYGNREIYDYRVANSGDLATIFLAQSAWGGGTKAGDKVFIRGCHIESIMRGFSTHNNVNFNATYGASYVEITDSTIISHGINLDGSDIGFNVPLFIQSLASLANNCKIVIRNTSINGFIVNYGAPTIDLVCDSDNLRQIWNMAGAGNLMTDQISTLAGAKLQYYPKLTEEINAFKNLGSVNIPRGYAVKRKSFGVEIMTSSDIASDFLGVAMQAIATGSCGDVKYKGYALRPYLDGLGAVTVSDGDAISVTSGGNFEKSNTHTVCIAADNQNIFIN